MKYMGSKNRISKHILPIILKDRQRGQYYVEPFVGGANSIDKVTGLRIGSDNNKYLIAMWQVLQKGWQPPVFIPRDSYNYYRDMYKLPTVDVINHSMIGYIGFNSSYGGKFFGGYAGITITKHGKERNYPLEAYKNVTAQVPNILDVIFKHSDYQDLEIPPNSIIYCDIPYKGATEYKGEESFNHLKFWDWCRLQKQKGHQVFVSEYNAPDDFRCVWEKEVSSSLRANDKISGDKKSVERLFTL